MPAASSPAASTSSSSPSSVSSSSVLPVLAAGLAAGTVRTARWVWDAAVEAWWVLRCLPRLALVLLAAALLAWWAGQQVAGSGFGLALGGLLGWPTWSPASWSGVVDRATTRRHRRAWPEVAASVGLSITRPHPPRSRGGFGVGARGGSGVGSVRVPRLLRRGTRTREGVARLRIRYAPGQTIDDLERAAPALAALLGAHAARVAPDGPSRAVVTLALRDLLDVTTHTPFPNGTHSASGVAVGHPLASVELGRTMGGQPWRADARVHTLVAGATGAGKGSVMHSLTVGIAPAVRAGTVRLVGIDLKAGMELSHAAGMFSALATTPEAAVAVLEREADRLTARAAAMAGKRRSHTPTADQPHVLLVIDELAALTAYLTDRDLTRRADTALRVILTQGRAPGWSVWAWVQDPRKDTVPMRNLFPQMIGLRLKDAYETEMVLGDGRARTAPCHRLPTSHPGTGYAITEDGHTTKVRAHYATDDLIHAVTRAYPTPHRHGIPDLAPTPNPFTRPGNRPGHGAPTSPGPADTPAAPAASDPGQPDTQADAIPDTRPDRRTSGRGPRKPRAPRRPRTTGTAGGDAA